MKMSQVAIFQHHIRETVERDVNDWLSEMPDTYSLVEIKLASAGAGPSEDQFVITTVMIIYEVG